MTVEYIQIGKIINTHGVKGELKIFPLTNNIYRFDHLRTAYLGENKKKVEVESVKYHKSLVILKFKEFNNINEVLQFKEEFLYVDIDDTIDLPQGRYFIFDIIGCEVYDTSNNLIGIVVEVIQSAGNDVYVVKNADSQKEYLIPAIKEFFTLIDVASKKIIIDPIEGMIE